MVKDDAITMARRFNLAYSEAPLDPGANLFTDNTVTLLSVTFRTSRLIFHCTHDGEVFRIDQVSRAGTDTTTSQHIAKMGLVPVNYVFSWLLSAERCEDHTRRCAYPYFTIDGDDVAVAVVVYARGERYGGIDPSVPLDWVAGRVTDGMLLDWLWDHFGWS